VDQGASHPVATETRGAQTLGQLSQGLPPLSRCHLPAPWPWLLSSGGGSGDQHPTCARQLQKWAGVGCDLCCGALWLPCTPALGCCSLRVPQPWRRGQPPQPLVTTASSAILPTTSLRTCLAASTVVTPSARHACGGWTLQLMSSTGFSAHSAARAHPRPAEGWPCWTWT
jgi:hypothetical protein